MDGEQPIVSPDVPRLLECAERRPEMRTLFPKDECLDGLKGHSGLGRWRWQAKIGHHKAADCKIKGKA
jgi:hypothetical protein